LGRGGSAERHRRAAIGFHGRSSGIKIAPDALEDWLEVDLEAECAHLHLLSNGIIAVPALKFGMPYGADPQWQVTFTDGLAEYPYSRRFATQD